MAAKTLIDYLLTMDRESMKETWYELNHWRWPLPFKPVWWDGIADLPSLTEGDILERRYALASVITDFIESRVAKPTLDAYLRKRRKERAPADGGEIVVKVEDE